MAEKTFIPKPGLRSWLNILRKFRLNVDQMKFTKKGQLKEILIEGKWYSIDFFQKFTNFIKKLIKKSDEYLNKYKYNLPRWFTVKPHTQKIKYI